MVTNAPWSPHHANHAAHPAPFRSAARALLLINSCRGFGGGSGRAEPAAEPGISLPPDALHYILQLAAQPLTAWVPLRRLLRLLNGK